MFKAASAGTGIGALLYGFVQQATLYAERAVSTCERLAVLVPPTDCAICAVCERTVCIQNDAVYPIWHIICVGVLAILLGYLLGRVSAPLPVVPVCAVCLERARLPTPVQSQFHSDVLPPIPEYSATPEVRRKPPIASRASIASGLVDETWQSW